MGFKKGDPKPPNSGRKPGVVNRSTSLVRDVIAQAAAALGGVERLVAWARESSENERTFWGSIYPKLLPLQLTGAGDGPVQITEVRRVIIDSPQRIKGPTIDAEPVVPDDGRNDSAKWAN